MSSTNRVLRARAPPPTLASTANSKRKQRAGEEAAPNKKAKVTGRRDITSMPLHYSDTCPSTAGVGSSKANPKPGRKTAVRKKQTQLAAKKGSSKAPPRPKPQGPVLRRDLGQDEEEDDSQAEDKGEDEDIAEEQLGEDAMDYAENDLWDQQEVWSRISL